FLFQVGALTGGRGQRQLALVVAPNFYSVAGEEPAALLDAYIAGIDSRASLVIQIKLIGFDLDGSSAVTFQGQGSAAAKAGGKAQAQGEQVSGARTRHWADSFWGSGG